MRTTVLAVIATLLLVFTTHQASAVPLTGEVKEMHMKRLLAGATDVAEDVVDAIPLSDIGSDIDTAVKDEVERVGQRL